MKNILIVIIVLIFISCRKEELPIVKDIDGNEYHYITVGSQVWMTENLRTTRYRNGDSIKLVRTKPEWAKLISGALCYYNNESNNIKIYGILYNWYALSDSRNVAPSGWRVATTDDWNTLINYLGGPDVAGGKLKEAGSSHWIDENSGASNSVNFCALPAGLRDNQGNFTQQGEITEWWIPEEYGTGFAFFSQIGNGITIQLPGVGQKTCGLSIRCVKE
jgi:uncharacterized protein (TIGR02145 family)